MSTEATMGSFERHTYEDPFLDMASTRLPKSYRKLQELCQIFAMTHPQIAPIIWRLAEYPITSITYTGDEEACRQNKDVLEKEVQILDRCIEFGLDYNAYGNCFVTLQFPFTRFYQCQRCNGQWQAKQMVNRRFDGQEFTAYCRQCKTIEKFALIDQYLRRSKGIRVLRLEPMLMTLKYNQVTGKTFYYYDIPLSTKQAIQKGDWDIIDDTPVNYITCVMKNTKLKVNRIFHFKRPTLSGRDMQWGLPLIMPALKDAYLNQIYKKADECVALDTKIETINGLVDADSVNVGDLVRTHTGKWMPVENKWYRDSNENEIGIKITLSCLRGLSSKFSPKHPVLVVRRNQESTRIDTKDRQISSNIIRNSHLYEPTFSPAGQVYVGEYVLYPKNLPEEDQVVDVAKVTGLMSTEEYVYSGQMTKETALTYESLERGEYVKHDNNGRAAKRIIKENREPNRMKSSRLMTDDFAYILGWYAGDGSCSVRHVCFSLEDTDNQIRLRDSIRREFDIECGTNKSGEHCVSVNLCNVIVRKLIKGLIPGKAKHKKIPIQITNASKKIKSAFLAGLFDSDGCESKDRDSLTLATSSEELAYDSWKIIISLGCIASISKRKTSESEIGGRKITGGTHYHVTVFGSSKRRLMSLMYEDGLNAQEVESAGKSGFFFQDYFAARVHRVEESHEKQYIDFKVSGDETFCTPGTATHNCIALEHAIPLRILFPEPGTQDPLSKISMGSFRGFMDQNLKYWRRDKNAILTAPLPVGAKVIGGDQSAYQTIQARQFVVDEIIGAMMVTKGFVMGNEQWSAGSISQRQLENTFLNYLRRLDICLQWISDEIGSFLRMPKCEVAMKPFKKVDDVQMLQLVLQMAREKKVSWNEVLSRMDLDAAEQLRQIEREAQGYIKIMIEELIGQAEAGAKSAVIQAQAQNESEGVSQVLNEHLQQSQQKFLPQGGGQVDENGQPLPEGRQLPADTGAEQVPGEGGQQAAAGKSRRPSRKQVDQAAQQLISMPPQQVKEILGKLHQEQPEFARAVAERANELKQEEDQRQQSGNVDIAELMSSASGPEDIAKKISVLDPVVKLKAMRAIQAKNPVLGLEVMKAISKMNVSAAGMAPGKDSVDMRPMPEQKPMRRQEKMV